MLVFFVFFSTLTTLLYASSLYFVLMQTDLMFHFSLGLIAVISTLITHCWVFFYFIGTGQGIREGVLEHKLDRAHIRTTKKFKAKVFPFALFSMIFAIVAAILGAGVQVQKVNRLWHEALVYLTIGFNLFTFYQEARIMKKNEKLMDELNACVTPGPITPNTARQFPAESPD